MARRKQTAAEYIEAKSFFVTYVLGDAIEQLGKVTQAWSTTVLAARTGDLDKALTHVADAGIQVDVVRVCRSELRSVFERAGSLLDAELPDDDEAPA